MNEELAIKLLGVPKGYSKDDIKSAYRKKSKIYHPDSPTGDEDLFKLLLEAKELLDKKLDLKGSNSNSNIHSRRRSDNKDIHKKKGTSREVAYKAHKTVFNFVKNPKYT